MNPQWKSWADGKWFFDSMELETAEHNYGIAIKMPNGQWRCTVSLSADDFQDAKAIVEQMVKATLQENNEAR